MTILINRRALMRLTAASATLGALPLMARADDTAIPPVPPVETYAASPMVDQIALSPNGKRVAMVSQKGDNKILMWFDIGSEDTKSWGLGTTKIRNMFWADDDHVVVVNSQTTSLPQFTGRKQEMSLAHVLNLKTLKMQTLFEREDEFYNIVMGPVRRVTIDGQACLMVANYRMSGGYSYCLFRFNLDTSRGHIVCETSKDTEGFVIAPDGYVVAYSEFDDDRNTWKLYYNTSPRGKMPIFKVIYQMKEALDYPDLEGIGHDGESVIIYFNKGDNKGEYHEITAGGVMGPALDTGDYISSTPLYHPTTHRFAGFSHNDDWITYQYTDPLLKKIVDGVRVMMGDDYRVAIADFADDPRLMILYGEDAQDAGTYYYADLTKGDLVAIASNYEDLPAEWISEKTSLTYKATDGLEVHGYLTLPPNKPKTNLPLIVLPHGGPQARDYIAFDWQVQALAAHGYAVLQPNFRGSSGYGSAFVEAAHGEFGRKMQTDLSDGVRHLVKQGIVDPKRVAILGASYGGYAALAGATLDPGVYNCAVSIAGIADPASFISFIAEKSDSTSSASVLYFKQFLGDPKLYDEISPAKQAGKAYCPILLIHGTDDTVVPIDQSHRMESALKRAGKPVEFVTYKGQDHWETVGSARIEMMKAALAFLDKHNPAG
ncbi:MAG: S9 family peptidase [Asticcacaulis sp.]|uniref:alpha/beta hydrolase family protein n=1 Tax=Asticcacaulis sp. TaxID=1872648 RepID=UPI0039E661BE